jgi:hypothetical protein
MPYNDHNPPHFHAEYAGGEVLINIQMLRENSGSIPRRAHAMVIEWADQHRTELMVNRERARSAKPPAQLEPLEQVRGDR